jgi:hypothetical protein
MQNTPRLDRLREPICAAEIHCLQMQIAFANNSGANPEEPLGQRPSGAFGPSGAFFNEKCGLGRRFVKRLSISAEPIIQESR